MDKFGVACGCPEGKPKNENMVKVGSGKASCGVCGREYTLDTLKLDDQIRVADSDELAKPKKK